MRRQFLENFRQFTPEWVVFVIASFIIGAMFTYHLYSVHQSNLSQYSEQLVHSASASEIIITQQLENINAALEKNREAFRPDWEQNNEKKHLLEERLELLASAMPSVQAITIINKMGTAIASSKKDLIGESFAQRTYFKTAAASPEKETLYVSPPFEGIYGDWLIALTKVIFDKEGRFAGIILLLLNSEEYKKSLDTIRATPQTWATLIHYDGMMFSWEPESLASTALNLATPNSPFNQYIHHGDSVSFFSDLVIANNKQSLIATRTISPTNLKMDKPLILAVGHGIDSLNQSFYSAILYISSVFLLINILSAIALYLSQSARHKSNLIVKEAESHILELSQQLASFFEFTPNLLAITNKKGYCLKINPSFQAKLGYTIEDLSNVSMFKYVHPDDRKLLLTIINHLNSGDSHSSTLVLFQHKNGHYLNLEVSISVQNDSFFLNAIDVTRREVEKNNLQTLAYHDRLTGLPNRILFFEKLEQAIETASRRQQKIALLFIDLDGFKDINDSYGHDIGDLVLESFAKRLTNQTRESDTVARLGGDEFVIILREINSEKAASTVANKIVKATYEEIPLETGENVFIGASIGISIWPDDGLNKEELLKAADEAMYESKSHGKNKFTFASDMSS